MRLLLLLGLCCVLTAGSVLPRKLSHEQILKYMSKHKMMKMVKDVAFKPENRKMSCVGCTLIVDGLQAMIRQNSTDNDIANFLIETCDFLNLEQPHVCKHIVEAFQPNFIVSYVRHDKDEVVFVLERTLFTPDEICGAFVPDCGHSENPLNDMWPLTIPDNKPPTKPWPTIPPNKPTYRFLHLSDIHIDRQYAVGSEAYCQLDDVLGTYAMCCRNYPDDAEASQAGKTKPIYVPAGRWGMPYACDLPYETFDVTLKHISETHTDLDYIIITGDFEAHDAWDYSEDLTHSNIQNVTAALLKYFPTTPIYVSIGNHEGVPQDAMAPHTMPEYDTRGPQWLYTIMKEMWANWLPQSALQEVQYRASYAVYVKPGLKLISINTIYCSFFNFYLYIDQRDPDATLEWLIEQLADSEAKGEVVHLMSHIPPGDNYCLKGWSWNFFEIVKRYENTIAQQFFGHTHYDHFQVYYEKANPNTNPFHFNWISPSMTTYAWLNPAYRIYTVDGGYEGATYTVKEAETYTTDLEAANKNNKEPVYSLEYKYTEFYGMKDLSPQSFSDLSDRLWTNKDLFRKFIKLYWRNSHDNECYTEAECQRKYICEIKKARSYDDSFCAQLN